MEVVGPSVKMGHMTASRANFNLISSQLAAPQEGEGLFAFV